MDYWFTDLPIALRMDGHTGYVDRVSGYVEVVPDTTISPDAKNSNWALGHVMLRGGDHLLFADSWQEQQVRRAILTSNAHVEHIRFLWGRSQRDMRKVGDWEAACA